MPHEFTITRRVEFADTDAAGLMHFSAYFRFMESAEHAFLRSLGHSVHRETPDGLVGWPRLRASCDYKRPLRFEDVVEVRLWVREKRSKSLAYDFVFRKLASGSGIVATVEEPEEVARGELVVVCAARPRDGERWAAALIPADLAAKIEAAPPDAPEAPEAPQVPKAPERETQEVSKAQKTREPSGPLAPPQTPATRER